MRKLVLASILGSIAVPIALFAYASPGSPTGFVNDFANILKPETAASIESDLKAFEASSKSEIAVVTVATIGTDENIETYATKLFEEWKIGKKGADNGLLLLVSRDDKQVRIEVGYGLEPSVTDIESGRIISEIIIPAFKSGDYDRGITQAVDRLKKDITNGAPIETSINTAQNGYSELKDNLSSLFYPLLFLFAFLARILGLTKSWWLGGVLGAVVGAVVAFLYGMFIGVLAGFVLVPLGLLFDYFVSKHYDHNGKGPRPPLIFGGGGFGSGRGGGFGGFGGGRSGGGGASGNW